ncbi:MAG TPA: S8 family serine peptidase, partial [Chloroflexota bacterium]
MLLLLFPAALAPSAGAATVSGGATRVTRELLAHIDAHPTARFPVILQMQPVAGPHSSARAADDALSRLRLHGQAITALPIIDGAAGVLPATAIRALANDPAVSFISEDLPVRRRDAAISSSALTTAYPPTVGAPWIWQKGDIGQGVTVAVLDSGILPDPDLVQPNNRILAAVNFADPLGSTSDPGGHGTHVAGIIAGNGTRSAGQFIGIAPGANLVDVRVLTAAGSGSASSVVAGIQWVVNHRDTYNIRVLNLSLGAPTATGYEQDPISAASEIAWLRGIVVIAATGNGGSGAVDSPGIDPYLISVGAADDNATNASSDDLFPTWSGWASLPFGPKPDLVAPGRRIVSIRAPGSTLDGQLPDHVVAAANGSSYFRLTGTSMAAAATSGAAALLLEQRAGLSPAQVKSILASTTQQFGQSTGISLPSP